MGRDKAQILVDGKPLWMRQLQTLRETHPTELLISAQDAVAFQDASCRVIPDAEAGQGPLGGIATLLHVMSNDWLLVLAVDVPRMTALFLRQLVSRAEETRRGSVCAHTDGKIEPLVAIYPRAALPAAQQQLQSGHRKLADFVNCLEVSGLITRYPVSHDAVSLFANWNTPTDLEPKEGADLKPST